MPSPSTQSSQSWFRAHRMRLKRAITTDNILYSILGLGTLAGLFYVGHLYFKESIPIEKELLSKTTTNTPISGFYGPGPWWGWLITLGISHGHTLFMALQSTDPEPEWDYDLIGASFFIVAAEVDLILKAKEISQLGDSATDYSGLLPALLCAERVVEVGMGFCLFTITTPLLVPHLLEHRFSAFRTAWVATIPLVFGIVASFFTFYVHKAIFETAPVIWWSMHAYSFTHVDYPAWTITNIVSIFAPLYVSPRYWMMAGIGTGSVSALVWVLYYLGQLHNLRNILVQTLLIAAILAASLPSLEVLLCMFIVGAQFIFFWIICWLPIYILAFCPFMGYFPLTGITRSVLDMDQFSALLAVVLVAAIRTWQPIYKTLYPSASLLESNPLLPVSSGGTGGSGEVEAY
ncbi:hypothetical protein B0H11DRAFT_2189297 [Mycena galericulata]|nr:hypothetical protein B0H11DRAFT_2189297 [Mycena galericulata]